jgi:hypothetical protein
MGSPLTYVRVSGKTTGAQLVDKLKVLNNVSIANAFRNIGDWFQAVGIGARTFNGAVNAGGAPATNTVTFTAFVNNDTVTINGVVFTGKTAGTQSGNAQFAIGASDTLTAVNFANLLNAATAPAKVLGVVQVTSAAAVATLTWMEPGAVGNLGTAAISAHGTVGAANFANGTDGTITLLAKGV